MLTSTPFDWVSDHLHMIGWPTLTVVAWRISRFLTKVEGRFLNAEAHVNAIPEMKATLESIDHNIDKLVNTPPVCRFAPESKEPQSDS